MRASDRPLFNCAGARKEIVMNGELLLLCGHGAGDPGACGNGYTETERVRALARRIKELGGNKVVLLDPNRNWYADRGINSLVMGKDDALLELHMDSGVKTARGGHVIIQDGLKADEYDNALAALLKDILPGRADMIVERNNLANPRRAAARGINYRLVEYGFISNASDVKVFNACMDDLARGTLEAFGIASATNVKPSATVKPNESVKDTDGKLSVDGHWGPKLTRRLQEIFEAMGYTITVDGKVSNQWACYADENPGLDETAFMWRDEPNGKGSQLIKAMQDWAGMPKDKQDGEIGPDTIKHIQRKLKKLGYNIVVDGKVSAPSMMVKALQEWANDQK